jgi:hypothetical protein
VALDAVVFYVLDGVRVDPVVRAGQNQRREWAPGPGLEFGRGREFGHGGWNSARGLEFGTGLEFGPGGQEFGPGSAINVWDLLFVWD